jgi:hypothetical protein
VKLEVVEGETEPLCHDTYVRHGMEYGVKFGRIHPEDTMEEALARNGCTTEPEQRLVRQGTGEVADVYSRPDTRPEEFVVATYTPGSKRTRLPEMTYVVGRAPLRNFLGDNLFEVYKEAETWLKEHAA